MRLARHPAHDLQEKKQISVQQISHNEKWVDPAGNMILAGYLGEIRRQEGENENKA